MPDRLDEPRLSKTFRHETYFFAGERMEGLDRCPGRKGLRPWPAGPRSLPGALWSGRREWSHLFAFQQRHSSLLPHGLRENALGELMEHGPGFPGGAKSQCPVQGIGHGLYALPGQGLETHGQVSPPQKSTG